MAHVKSFAVAERFNVHGTWASIDIHVFSLKLPSYDA